MEQYKEDNTFIFAYSMNSLLPELKKEYDWLALSPAQSLQQKCQNLDTALKGCFRHGRGFPKFKAKHRDTSGITFPQGWHLKGNRINLPKLKGVKIKIHRDIPDTWNAGSCIIKRDRVGDWFVSILYKIPDFEPAPNNVMNPIGIDVGLKEFAVTSEAEIIPNPKFLGKSEKRLKMIQRNHSRKKKGSANRERSRIKLAKAHRKIARQRKDFIKQSAASIAKKHDAVFVEDLNVKGMVRNHHLAKSIADVGWGMFIRELEWQCQKRSKHFAKIDRWYPSSKTCSACGWKNTELLLSDRVFVCRGCGTEIDRDLNAAFNILKQGTLILRK